MKNIQTYIDVKPYSSMHIDRTWKMLFDLYLFDDNFHYFLPIYHVIMLSFRDCQWRQFCLDSVYIYPLCLYYVRLYSIVHTHVLSAYSSNNKQTIRQTHTILDRHTFLVLVKQMKSEIENLKIFYVFTIEVGSIKSDLGFKQN